MKNYLLISLCFLFSVVTNSYSQDVIPNGSFENWSGYNPTDWVPLLNTPTFQNVVQSSDAQSGSSSVELIILYYPLVSAWVESGMISTTIPMSTRPGALNGYYKGTAAGNDSLSIILTLVNNNSPVGFAVFSANQSVSGWTGFSAPITYISEEVPDGGTITMAAGSDVPTSGTVFYIDNLTFGEAAGINEKPAIANYSLFPNPAQNVLNVTFTLAESDNVIFELISPLGAVIPVSEKMTFQQGTNTYQLSTASFTPGIYFLKVLGEKYQVVQKFIIQR